MAILTDEHQPFIGTVLGAGMPTPGTSLTAVVGINLDRHTLMQEGFIGNHAMQFGKAPLAVGSVGFPLLLARFLALASPDSLSNMSQVFQPDQTVWVLFHNALAHNTIHVMVDTLKFHGVALEEVRLEHVSISPIYLFSTALLWRNGSEQKLEMRPGDALGLALLMECPLLLTDELERFLVTLTEGQTPELYLINDLLRREGITLTEGKNCAWATAKHPCAMPSSKSSRTPSWAKHHLSLKKTWSSEKRLTWPFCWETTHRC